MSHCHNNNVWPIRAHMDMWHGKENWRYEIEPGDGLLVLRSFRLVDGAPLDMQELHFPKEMLVTYAKAWFQDTADSMIGDMLEKFK